MRIAHLSDLHILDLKGVGPRRFLNQRAFGALNLLTARRNLHSPLVFECLLEDALEQRIDHVVITGDLSNLALQSEFERVSAYLRIVWDFDQVSVVPGNHDYYTAGTRRSRRFEKAFYRYMFPDFCDLDSDPYPYAKSLGPVTLFGFCSAAETPPLMSWGQIDQAQMMRFVALANEPRTRESYNIALLHHYFHDTRGLLAATSRLREREKLAELLVDNGIDLVLHGHDHRAHVGFLGGGKRRRIPVIGCGSSTALTNDPNTVARYNIYTIKDGALTEWEIRRYEPATRRFHSLPGPDLSAQKDEDVV